MPHTERPTLNFTEIIIQVSLLFVSVSKLKLHETQYYSKLAYHKMPKLFGAFNYVYPLQKQTLYDKVELSNYLTH